MCVCLCDVDLSLWHVMDEDAHVDVWRSECGMWNMECGTWNVECGL